MNIAAQLQTNNLSMDSVLIAGLLGVLILVAAGLAATLIAARRLGRRLDAQADELAELRIEARDKAPARAAVAAAVVVNGDRSANLAALETQLSDLMAEWQHVEDLSEEAYAILRELRQRAAAEAGTE
jgi:gas vesicle protein